MTTLQLELNLQQLAEAQTSPQAVNWQQLCLAFDATMDQTPVEQRLAAAADAIAEMGELFAVRADEFFSSWQRQRVAHEGPVLDDDFLGELVRQSFHLDLDGLVGEPELYMRSASERVHDAESVVEEVTKETALLLAGAEEEPEVPMPVSLLEHDENTIAWAEVLQEWMRVQGLEEVGLPELVTGVGLSMVKVWLALLLCGFELRQEGGFYDVGEIKVGVKV